MKPEELREEIVIDLESSIMAMVLNWIGAVCMKA